MRELAMLEAGHVSGGSDMDDDYSDVTQIMDTIVVTATALEGGGFEITFSGSFLEGIQTAIADCANGAEVGALFGGAMGLALAGVGVAPGAMAGAAAGCVSNTGVGLLRVIFK